jgi:hypothetical protein
MNYLLVDTSRLFGRKRVEGLGDMGENGLYRVAWRRRGVAGPFLGMTVAFSVSGRRGNAVAPR